MNVLVDMYISSTLAQWAGGLYISSVDFGCFSTKYGDCEALEEREGQVTFTLFVYMCMVFDILCTYGNERKMKDFC